MTTQKPASYFSGVNVKLLDNIPRDACRVVEFGCAEGKLAAAAKERMPHLHWTGVDVAPDALAAAATRCDRTVAMDATTERDRLAEVGDGFDLVVMGDFLEHVADPAGFLRALRPITTEDARILACVPNMAHWTVLARFLTGDLSYDPVGLLDDTHLRFFSPASVMKDFLDGGWLPDMIDRHKTPVVDAGLVKAFLDIKGALGIPRTTATRTLGTYQMILAAARIPDEPEEADPPPVSVVVPVNRRWQLDLNVTRSPGLKEMGAEIVPVENAPTAAAALEDGLLRASHNHVLLCHQDVYFPAGFGRALAARLAGLRAAGEEPDVVGFAGIADDPGGTFRKAGLLVDRTRRFDFAATNDPLSMDEFAVLLRRDGRARPDHRLGWHLWATDLCLQLRHGPNRGTAAIVRTPIFHNSVSDYSLPDAFHASARVLKNKYPDLPDIPTLCAVL